MTSISRIERLDAPLLAAFGGLLEDSVNGGASVGFHPPLDPALNAAYWAGIAAQVESGATVLFAAREPDGTLAGSVQLALCPKQNGPHRTELQKLLVHSAHRRKGVARRLLAAAEAEAKRLGRKLLVLDTRQGDAGVPLYESTGWIRAGAIPGYTLEVDGSYHTTVLFYRQL